MLHCISIRGSVRPSVRYASSNITQMTHRVACLGLLKFSTGYRISFVFVQTWRYSEKYMFSRDRDRSSVWPELSVFFWTNCLVPNACTRSSDSMIVTSVDDALILCRRRKIVSNCSEGVLLGQAKYQNKPFFNNTGSNQDYLYKSTVDHAI